MTDIIAEVKTHSPFGFRSERSWEYLLNLASEIGDIISIHTDPRWNGSFDDLEFAKTLKPNIPILAKGIHSTDDDIKKAIDYGADWVLVVGRIPRVHEEKCIVELISIKQLKEFNWIKSVWNARDLDTGKLKNETFKEARLVFDNWLCQASFIKSQKDIQDGADAVIIGENLESFAKLYEKNKH